MTNDMSEATIDLLSKIRAGDTQARDRLLERTIPALQRWARGRLPQWARSLTDTQDLVQDVVVRTLPRLSSFEPNAGGLQAFLRTAVHHRIIDEIRRARPRQATEVEVELQVDPSPSPLELAIKREGLEK